VELGAYAEALHVAEHGVARLRVLDMPFVLLWVLDALAWAHLAFRQGDPARQVGEEMLRLSQRLPLPLFIYQPNARLCAACVLTGDWACAHTYALQATEARIALALADLTHANPTVALLWGGDVALAREGVGRFGAVIGAKRRFRIPYLRALATLAQWEGATAQAIVHLEEAQALAAQVGLPGEQWQLAALLAQTYRDQGQVAQAERAQARAEATLQALAEGLPDPALRASFLAAAERTRRGCLRGAARSATAPDPGRARRGATMPTRTLVTAPGGARSSWRTRDVPPNARGSSRQHSPSPFCLFIYHLFMTRGTAIVIMRLYASFGGSVSQSST
jgi:ATP/maltotriose-dependent transcriptional regulator MalT